ncbi:MAG: hypothetical protein JXB32_09650 [Deltaproteobacteria bacterium]|nr:hypothetical protein [Deltaproteobacteria bacterium]
MTNDTRCSGGRRAGCAAALLLALLAGCGDDDRTDGGSDVDVDDVLDGNEVDADGSGADADGADDGPDDPCIGVDCSSPPPPSCVDEATLRTHAGAGRCVDGACVYDDFHDDPCTDCCYGAEINLTGEPLGGGPGYSRILDPADADFVVSTADELLAALAAAVAGSAIYVADAAEIDLDGHDHLDLPGGVTLASGRGRDGSAGGLIACDTFAYPLFVVRGEGVRLTGLRLRGPNPDIGDHDYDLVVHSGAISSRFRGFEVDNCELWAWGTSAVSLGEGADDALVHHNFIHHTRRAGLGYGVVLDRAAALIEGNVFDFCRHHIAATGRPGTSYEARYNLVLEHANGHGFDMHGAPDYDKYDTKAIWRLDEGEGTHAGDSSVSGYHPANDCTLAGMDPATCWVAGVVNTGLELDGVDDRLECGTDASLTAPEGSFTLWVRPAAGGRAAGLLDLFTAAGDGCVVGLDAAGHVEVEVTTGGVPRVALASEGVVAPGDWHHVAVTQDGTGVLVYIDGTATPTTGTNADAWTAGLALAGVWVGDGPAGNLAGMLDEVRVYDRALAADEVARHAAGNPDIAGNRIVLHHNTFRDVEQSAIVIRGVPAEGALIHHNWFHGADPARAIRQVYAVGNLVAEDNHFGLEVPAGTVLPVARAELRPGFGRAPLATRGDARASSWPLGPLDGWRWDFGDGEQAEGITVEHSYAAPGRYLCRTTVRDERGARVDAFSPVTASPDAAGYRLDFWVKDSYAGPLAGFYEKQALVDGAEVWSDDVADVEGWEHVSVDLDAAAAGRERLDLTLRVQSLAAVDGELIELDVFWDDVKLFGGTADGDDFEDGGGWSFARSGAPFSGRTSSMEPHAGNWAYRINSPYATPCPAGAWGEIRLAVPLLPRALLGRWTFDDGGGTAAEDSSLYGNHGTLLGTDASTAWVPGIVGGALAFDGVDDEVALGPAASLATPTGTLLLWLEGGTASAEQTVFEVRDADGRNSFLLGRTADDRLLVRAVQAGTTAVELTSTASLGGPGFHHVALTQDGSGARLYLDGSAAAATGTDGPLLTGHVTPARATLGAGSAGHLAGSLDELRLHADVLDAAAIAADFRRGRALAAWSLDDGAGTTARDASGEGHDGTLVGFAGDAAWVAGRVGGALDFDGTDDRVEVAAPAGLATAEGTLELWFDADTLDDNRDLANLFEDGYQNFLLLRRTTEGRILLLIEDDDAALASVTTSTSFGSGWHHVAVTQDGSGLAVYVDGRPQPSSGSNSSAWTDHLALTGAWLGGGHWSHFDGRLDEVRLWARALTPAEIAAHAAEP